ncbi:Spx/MgsR family RNA polymerase-binding regulatory protein [Pedobacter foliorum]|uniref:Spx/MgsR family RNA polymerase-binding regulatory protein n=1 Tax=Pedobacter foliorum TaxID=2739058 RepID=UPI0015667D3E|nr:Spx/MgsR family RNA polymerase-binding regulatory protein [Pedobacter foliorum]NRF38993.1 Spx/MgsR family RNA polymerase-binding regulatory protein [Pedobacter foliorum]
MIVYGIPNCNTVKKAMTWLVENGFKSEFHDFKKKGITAEKLNEWCDTFGWEIMLNKKGTTWKKLSAEEQQEVNSKETAIKVLLMHNSAIKRPIVEVDGKAVLVSFNEENYQNILK